MSMFDEITLMEYIPCHVCFSTHHDKLENDFNISKVPVGNETLEIIRLTDGLGGIKSFQTKDVYQTLDHFLFPGIIHFDEELFIDTLFSRINRNLKLGWETGEIDKPNHEAMDILRSTNKLELNDLYERCNKCNTLFEGKTSLDYIKEDNVLVFKSLEFWDSRKKEDNSFLQKEENNYWYKLERYSSGRIVLTPNFESATKNFLKLAHEKDNLSEDYQNGIDHLLDLSDDIKIFKELLHKMQKKIISKPSLKDKFAYATDRYEKSREIKRFSKYALIASLLIAERIDKTKSENVFSLSKVCSEEEYELQQKWSTWYFNKEYKSIERFLGICGGPNYFFNELIKE